MNVLRVIDLFFSTGCNGKVHDKGCKGCRNGKGYDRVNGKGKGCGRVSNKGYSKEYGKGYDRVSNKGYGKGCGSNPLHSPVQPPLHPPVHQSKSYTKCKSFIYENITAMLSEIIPTNDIEISITVLTITSKLDLKILPIQEIIHLFNLIFNEILLCLYRYYSNGYLFRRNDKVGLWLVNDLVINFGDVLGCNYFMKYLVGGLEHPCKKVKFAYCYMMSVLQYL